MKRKQMMISFGAYDDDVYEFLQENKNASALVRMLVRNYMNNNECQPTPKQAPAQVDKEIVITKSNKKENIVETSNFDYSKCGNNNLESNSNRSKIKSLDL